MASIPLVALGVKDQQQNPLDTYSKGVALQGLLANQQQQQQLRPLQLQEAQNQLELQQNQLDDAKRAVALRQAMKDAYSNAVVSDPATGQPSINGSAVVQHLAQAGQGAAIPEVQKSLDAFNKSHAELQELTTKNQQASLDYFANMAHAVKVANYDPVVASTFLGAMAHQAGPYQQQAQATLDHIQQDPSSIKPFVDQIEQASEKQRQAASAETTAAARMKSAEKEPAGNDEARAIQDYLEAHNLPDTAQNRMTARSAYIQENKVNPGVQRMIVLGNMREYPGIDPNTLQPTYQTPNQIHAAQAQGGGGLMPGSLAQGAMQKTALMEDIRGGIQQVRDSLNGMSDEEFSMKDRALIAGALKSRDPRGALTQLIGGQLKGALNDKQQEYIQNLANLTENAMAMRSVLGAGQGSEDLRNAITATIPGASTPNRKYALGQLQTFEKTLNRLERGIPNVPIRPDANAATQNANPQVPNGATGIAPGSDGKRYYHDAQGKILGVAP